MKTIREWASELPKDFEASILSHCLYLHKESDNLSNALCLFCNWDNTVEGRKFWITVYEDLIHGKKLKSYSHYLTDDSDIEAVDAMQGWDLDHEAKDELKKAVNDFISHIPSGNRYNLPSSLPPKYRDFFNPQPHYDNSKGSLYKVAEERGWNTYLFDIVKRLERSEKKGEFEKDLDKSIDVIKLWKMEKGQ